MRLRSHLLLMMLAVLLPVLILGVSGMASIAEREGLNFEVGARERTRAILTAVDAALTGQETSLRALATTRSLEADDIAAFYDDAVRMLATQPDWVAVDLSLPSGEIILDTPTGDPQTARSFRDRPSFHEALSTGEIAIGGLLDEDGAYRFFAAHLPVVRGGTTRYVLTALIHPHAILNLLTVQRLPTDWVGVVLDRNQRIVARTLNPGQTLGSLASPSLIAALARAPEGFFHGVTLEGADVYTPYMRSETTGWTVALGIPARIVNEAEWDAARQMAMGVAGALSIAIVLAVLLSRQIAAPIVRLASTAKALGTGATITPPAPGGILEVRELHQALAIASQAVREREDALRATDRAKDEFLAMLSHELRNPLGAISSAAAYLQRSGHPSESATAPLGVISRQVQQMTRLVDDLLDVSRATSGKISLTRHPLDLAEIVTRALGALLSGGRLDRHDVRQEVSPVWIDADEARIEQVVSNLVINAVKYTPPGGRIMVRAFPRAHEAVLEVEDTGVGLAPELAGRVFDLFVQGDRSLDRNAGGLGIGLTLVRRLVEMHGGEVGVQSDGPGRGSCFTVTLPALAHPPQWTSAAPPKIAAAHDAARRRILVIEDNDDARTSLRAVLEAYGYETVEAADGPAGIQSAARLQPDVAIVDIGLAGMDGYEVARKLREMPGGRERLLIALTGYGQASARQRAFEAGFDAHLTKPAEPERLVEMIEAKLGSVEQRP